MSLAEVVMLARQPHQMPSTCRDADDAHPRCCAHPGGRPDTDSASSATVDTYRGGGPASSYAASYIYTNRFPALEGSTRSPRISESYQVEELNRYSRRISTLGADRCQNKLLVATPSQLTSPSS